MNNKYIIFCEGLTTSTSEKVMNIIKEEIKCRWYNVHSNSSTIIINTGSKKYSSSELRDLISNRVSCSVWVMQIRTTKNSAAHGSFADSNLWDWIKEFDTDDSDIESETDLPNVALNSSQGNVCI